MSFSLAMMCFTKQLAASSMLIFSWKKKGGWGAGKKIRKNKNMV